MTGADRARPASHPVVRTAVLWLALVVSLQTRPRDPELLMPVVMAAGVVAVVALLCGRWADRTTERRLLTPVVPAVLLVLVGFFASVSITLSGVRLGTPWFELLLAGLVLGCLGVLLPRHPASAPAYWLFVLLWVVVGLVFVAQSHHHSDVFVYLRDASHALLNGHDPYAVTFPDPYTRQESETFFGAGLVDGDRLDFGFPYLPASLLLHLPFAALGDVRVACVVALALTSVLVRRLARDDLGRVLALVPLTMPTVPETLEAGWVEPALAVLLVWVVLAMSGSSRRGPGLALGLLLASKQYLVVALPLLVSLARSAGRGPVLRAVALAAVLVGGFVLWDPHAFVRSAVELHLRQPYRSDSVSLAVAWGSTFGELPAWVYGVPPLLVATAVSAVLARRARPGPSTFALGVGLSLLTTVLLSKQAFGNYFLFIELALVVGAVAWTSVPVDGPDAPTVAHGAPVAAVADRDLTLST